MKTKINNIFAACSVCCCITAAITSCSDYLDVVPDNTQEVSAIYNRKEMAYNALATCYHYLPEFDNTYSFLGMSDEMIMGIDRVTDGKNAMLGKISADRPIMSYWYGDTGASWYEHAPCEASLFIPLRICNSFLNNIGRVPDMTQSEISRWSAEVTFLKAYYHFLLFTQYGAIPLVDKETALDVSAAENQLVRVPVDSVVNYIVGLLDESVDALPIRIINTAELGRIDQLINRCLKAKVLLYAASPLFNNNPLYYSLENKDGTKLFPQDDKELEAKKWQRALAAYEEAMKMCSQLSVKLYRYPASDYSKTVDARNFRNDSIRLPYMYNYQYAMVTKWNEEVIWGASRTAESWYSWHNVQRSINYKSSAATSTGDAWQWFGPTLNATEFFYTKNGLPLDEDPTFDYVHRDSIVTITADHNTVAQVGEQTAYMFMNREPRFYASIGFDRSRVRGYGTLYNLKMRYQEANGRQSHNDIDVPTSGVFLRKLMHPDTQGNGTITLYPWPIIRYNEMMLSYAECLNEVYGEARQQDVLNLLDSIRSRAGVPTVEEAWANAKHPNMYTTKDGMRQIIKQERTAELAFECYRHDDVRRWLEGSKYFNTNIYQWNADGTTAQDYYQRRQDPQLLHVFTTRNYLWPIPTDELVKNPLLVQNPGY
ncbi:MAG: RagB/SusD family nutrient uptake outer membrane protein [Bacteroidaceae bacterium]|nr:RagB/SusD family nutrient uptake outer membrane protein [Bacteroidaceae bacterium]